ncbi:hypothetical protein QR680_002868 [Steinernema hermaphroditum]|uniref:Uncharacterized protein n=1 Tax=Steinernema hermaphroditum TaxID=289476 RepID=A0AA39LJ40_9BILA|nr:hypothetical protein QR680_002868 [Steinernema hermaphroditum]
MDDQRVTQEALVLLQSKAFTKVSHLPYTPVLKASSTAQQPSNDLPSKKTPFKFKTLTYLKLSSSPRLQFSFHVTFQLT